MLTVDDYGRIRRAHRRGMSIRAIARTLHRSRRKVREALRCPEPTPYTRTKDPAKRRNGEKSKGRKPTPYTRTKDPPAPKLGPLTAIIDEILKADETAPRKQRHTAAQIFRRLRDERGYIGGYDQVRRYVGRHRRRQRETFIPLVHEPGQRLECDFGHIHVDFPEGRRQVPVLLPTWAYSYCPFAIALPTERTEAILAGMVEAFEFFNCVPREVWWDNPKTVATVILKGRSRTLNARYAALASHYAFEPLFCMPARGNEKPHTENRVYDLQRRWATPVPKVKDLGELNAYLRTCCLKDRSRTVAGQTETIAERFERERAAADTLPVRAFDACVLAEAKVDKYQTVRFDSNRYSTPRTCAFRAVTVKGYVDHIEIVADGQVVARHERCYGRQAQILDPVHYLVTLGRRPAALDHAHVYRTWRLPAVFTSLRADLEARYDPFAGARQYIRVLQLPAQHPVQRVEAAIRSCPSGASLSADRIIQHTFRLAKQQIDATPSSAGCVPSDPVLAVQVPLRGLDHFDAFLSRKGEPAYA